MQPLQTVALAAMLASYLGYGVPPARRLWWFRLTPPLAVGLTALHVWVEGPRWQMAPAYALAVVLGVLTLRTLYRPSEPAKPSVKARRVLAVTGAVLAALSILTSAALATALPVFELPVPSGPYAVGSTTLLLTDKARGEPFTADPEDRRELLVVAWYPAQPSAGATPSPYLPDAPRILPPLIQVAFDAAAQGGSSEYDAGKERWAPTFLLNHLALVRSHSFENAPVAGSRAPYPVVVFSHGYLVGHVRQNTMLMEHLASHGFMVFSIAHPFEGLYSIDASGRLRTLGRYTAVPLLVPTLAASLYQNSDAGVAAIEAIVDAPTSARRDTLLRRYLTDNMADWYGKSGRLWREDTRFVIDELERMNAGHGGNGVDRFRGRLDLSRLGLAGMSFGGKIVPRYCAEDRRCRAGFDLDGGLPLLEELDGSPPVTPMLLMFPEDRTRRYALLNNRFASTVYRVALHNTVHASLFELSLAANPLFKLKYMDARRSLAIVNDYALAFFDRYLNGRSSSLLAGPSPYPDVTVEKSR